jgi:DNA-binding response OmpR family regulator
LIIGRSREKLEKSQGPEEPMNTKPKLLIAEDDRALGALLKRALLADGHEVRLVSDGEAAVAAFKRDTPDMVILDLGLPKIDGSTVLQELRTISNTIPVLILTGLADLEVRLQCFSLGADDCMLKPFALRELRARCLALLKRRASADAVLRYNDLEMDRMAHSVNRAGVPIALTNKEYGLLECLMLNQGRCVSRNLLMEQVWKLGTEASTNVVDVYVNYLRRKLQESRSEPLIATVRGEGYRIGVPSQLGA